MCEYVQESYRINNQYIVNQRFILLFNNLNLININMYKIFYLHLILFVIYVNAIKSKISYKDCKKIKFTNYWIPKEGEKDMDNDGKIVKLIGKKNKEIKDNNEKVITKVSENTYNKCQMEGTCLLNNGIMINLGKSKNNFEIIDRKKFPYGKGNNDNPLMPFISVASNDLKIGTKILVKELINKKLPNGLVHNGCVRVDDNGWSFNGCQLDFFVLEFQYYKKLNTPDEINIVFRDKNCTLLNYKTKKINNWSILNNINNKLTKINETCNK